jgi:hypothetical protein
MSTGTSSILPDTLPPWLVIISIIILAFVTGVLIANAIYFHRLESDTTGVITKSSASFLRGTNAFFAFVTGVLFIIALIYFFLHESAIKRIRQLATQPGALGVVKYSDRQGWTTDSPSALPVVTRAAPRGVPVPVRRAPIGSETLTTEVF